MTNTKLIGGDSPFCYLALDFEQEMQSRAELAAQRSYERPNGQDITIGNKRCVHPSCSLSSRPMLTPWGQISRARSTLASVFPWPRGFGINKMTCVALHSRRPCAPADCAQIQLNLQV